jgi:hypothetical protein
MGEYSSFLNQRITPQPDFAIRCCFLQLSSISFHCRYVESEITYGPVTEANTYLKIDQGSDVLR